ncbi:DUF5330 domain-containing protein [Stappia sp.]|jgi:hypothetical protein|uniref:DUF5330 domain-containing protein n=1 Tax=Stappia sp. TaxID=1870903 RepID=UPI003A99560A
MYFLLKSAFWIGLVLLILPIDTGPESTETPGLNPVNAFFAAQSTISDLSGFCTRNPAACETGGQAIARIGAKARVSARMIYDYLDEETGDGLAPDTTVTGGTNTLTAEDLAPEWKLVPVAANTEPAGAPATTLAAAPDQLVPHGPVALPRPKPRASDRPV